MGTELAVPLCVILGVTVVEADVVVLGVALKLAVALCVTLGVCVIETDVVKLAVEL